MMASRANYKTYLKEARDKLRLYMLEYVVTGGGGLSRQRRPRQRIASPAWQRIVTFPSNYGAITQREVVGNHALGFTDGRWSSAVELRLAGRRHSCCCSIGDQK